MSKDVALLAIQQARLGFRNTSLPRPAHQPIADRHPRQNQLTATATQARNVVSRNDLLAGVGMMFDEEPGFGPQELSLSSNG